MDKLLRDLRFGVRLLWKEKAVSLTVLLTLAVCIGANTAIFGVIDTVMLRPLPYPQPDRLVRVFNSYPNAGAMRGSNSAPDYFYRRSRVPAFQNVAEYQFWGNTVGEAGSPERIQSMRVTASFFPLLGVKPLLGRTFTEDEMEPGNAQKVVLSYGFWQERYAGDPSVIGQDLRVDGRPYTIVGVLPRGFHFLGQQDRRFYLPIPYTPADHTPEQLHSNNFEMIARLAPGATVEQAASQIKALDASLVDQVPIPNAKQILKDAGYHAVVVDLKADLLRDVRPTLIMLWAGVAFVLLIGCVNIANLMLARSSDRARELATRIALGANRRRLAGQLITEAVLLALIGGALGLAAGAGGMRLLAALGANDLPRGAEGGVNAVVVLFTFLLTLAAGVFFGGIPLAHVFHTDLNAVFRAESRSGTASRKAVLLRGGLVTAQVALAFVLLIGAGLMFASFRAALKVDPGFNAASVLTGYISMPTSRYPDAASRSRFLEDMLAQVRALPGVQAAAVTSQIPFGGNNSASVVLPEGYVPKAGESLLSPFNTVAGPGYFKAMGIPILQGRGFEASDDSSSRQVMVIDRWLAHRYWPDSSPIGKRMLLGVPGMTDNDEALTYTIVGVVGDVKQNDLTETDHVGAYYFTYKQQSRTFFTLVVHTTTKPTSLVAQIRKAVSGIDPDMPFYMPQTMSDRIADTLRGRRIAMLLLMAFAAVALFLAAVGIYGVLAYSVTQRTRELGVRMALGGSPGEVFRLVLRQGLRVIAFGLVLGALGSLLLVRLIRALLYGVRPTDPAVLVVVAATLAAVGVLACVLPARRATRIDPMVALGD
ncbi:MAG: ABC transporter permease [Gemmatimonadota bacterium]